MLIFLAQKNIIRMNINIVNFIKNKFRQIYDEELLKMIKKPYAF